MYGKFTIRAIIKYGQHLQEMIQIYATTSIRQHKTTHINSSQFWYLINFKSKLNFKSSNLQLNAEPFLDFHIKLIYLFPVVKGFSHTFSLHASHCPFDDPWTILFNLEVTQGFIWVKPAIERNKGNINKINFIPSKVRFIP